MTFQLIETIELTSQASSLDFTNIPATDNADLYFIGQVRFEASGAQPLCARVNDISTYDYHFQRTYNSLTGFYGDASTQQYVKMDTMGSNFNTTNYFSPFEMSILDYTATEFKNGHSRYSNFDFGKVRIHSFQFDSYEMNTAINKVSFFTPSYNLASGTKISMYVVG